MPTYDYSCQACGHELEASQKITASPLTTCPSCGKEELQRGVGGGSATFRFIGSGFYLNDYKEGGEESSSSCACGKNACSDT
ncbi:MAG: hypothetical protein K940chlam9_01741 [Chlamydiae bacterium]|nr:hypothetical protein [Chlamydiota bacterium]